jgi:hypothetical protein
VCRERSSALRIPIGDRREQLVLADEDLHAPFERARAFIWDDLRDRTAPLRNDESATRRSDLVE